MADHTHIEWTDATWNPITGCSVVSPGCTNCYAMRLAGGRLVHHPSRAGLTTPSKAGPVWNGEVRLNEAWLAEPLRWKGPRRIFVCAHGDLFHEAVPDAWIDKVFAVMALAPHHTFQVLTKRPERMRAYIVELLAKRRSAFTCLVDHAERQIGWTKRINEAFLQKPEHDWKLSDPWLPLPNVWLGVSAEDQQRADERIPILHDTPAAVRFVSLEPLLGPMEIGRYLRRMIVAPYEKLTDRMVEQGWSHPFGQGDHPDLDWVIVGGESGPGARPMHPAWARRIRDDCADAGVPFFFKQCGEWTPGENVDRHSGTVDVAYWFDNQWLIGDENLASDDGHIDDEPDLYRLGKKAAGRLLDGVAHDAMPAARASP